MCMCVRERDTIRRVRGWSSGHWDKQPEALESICKNCFLQHGKEQAEERFSSLDVCCTEDHPQRLKRLRGHVRHE